MPMGMGRCVARIAFARCVVVASCATLALLVSLITSQKKSDTELSGLVWSLTPRIIEEDTIWYKRPFMLGLFVLVLVLILNIIFW